MYTLKYVFIKFADTWMGIEDIKMSEIWATERVINRMITLMCGLKRNTVE